MAMSNINVPLGMLDGYVVMPLKEYNELLQQIEMERREAHKAHSLAAEATLKAKQELESTLDNLCIIETLGWASNGKINVHFNDRAMFDLAMRKLVKAFSEEELAKYTLKELAEFIVGDMSLGRRKPDEAE